MPETVLLTGATGFVGQELLRRLTAEPETEVACLIRGFREQPPAERLRKLTAGLGISPAQAARARALPGDFAQELLGLPRPEWERLAAETTRIVHCGASVSWSLPLEEARRINTGGTVNMLALARAARRLGRFDYVSTAHVCGRRKGLIAEDSLDDSAGFFNTYEQSKFEAERLVRESLDSLPVSVFRLSTVVGDSQTGRAASFKVMYWPLKMLSRGWIFVAPGSEQGIVDIVPVDYVCDALEAISRSPASRGRTFHLAAGPSHSTTVGEILTMAAAVLKVRKPLLLHPVNYARFVRPLLSLLVWGKQRERMRRGRVYMPYVAFEAAFDTSAARNILEPLGLAPPRVSDYFRTLVDFAVATDWGRNPPPERR